MSLPIINKVNALKRLKEQRRKAKQERLDIGGSVPFSKYADNPVGFCIEVLEIQPTEEQKLILESVRDRSITNVKAAHGVGKSLIAAVCVLYYVFAVGGLAITTAPTEDQVKQILWAEIRKLYDRHKKKLGGTRGELFLRYSESARAYGFSSKNYDSSSFQGKHGERLLLIGDEYDGITEVIDDGFRSCLTGTLNRGLRIGNPINPQSAFAQACAKDPSCLTISAWGHPNVSWAYEQHFDGVYRLKPEIAELIIGENSRVLDRHLWKPSPLLLPDRIPGAISVKWIEDARVEKSEGSAFWVSRVDGNYPTDATDGVIPMSLLRAARDRYDNNRDYWESLAKQYSWRLGLDVGDGVDNHALALWRGPVLYEVQIHPTKGDLMDTERAAQIAQDEMRLLGGSCRIGVDNQGVGAGTLAILLKRGVPASGCRFGEGAKNKKLFDGRKAELYWEFREMLRKGEVAIAPLGEKEDYIFADLSATRYTTNTKGQIVCEKKEKARSRLGRSPDSEAAVIALVNPIEAGGIPADAVRLSMSEDDYTMDDMERLKILFMPWENRK